MMYRSYLSSVVSFFALFLLFQQGFAFDWAPLDTGPRNAAMGGAWLASGRGSQVACGNPALIVLHEQQQLSLLGVMAFDEFDGYDYLNDESSQDRPDPYGTLLGGGVVAIAPSSLSSGIRSGAAFTVQRAVPMGLALDQEDSKGGPLYGAAGIALRFPFGVSVGLGARLVGGSRRVEEIDFSTIYYAVTYTMGLTVEFESLGLPLPATLGLTYQPGYQYEAKSDTYRYPAFVEVPPALGVGLALKPFRLFQLSGDARFHFAEGKLYQPGGLNGNQKYPLTSQDETEIELRGGAEVALPVSSGTLFLRGGICLLPTLADFRVNDFLLYESVNTRARNEVGYSYGAGLRTGKLSFDAVVYQRSSEIDAWLIPNAFFNRTDEPEHGRGELQSTYFQLGMTLYFNIRDRETD